MWFGGTLARQERVAAHPLLADLRTSAVRQWARAADEVEFVRGDVLLREDRAGYWFLLISEGSVTCRRAGRRLGTLTAGAHLGHEATLMFRPQPTTVVAETTVRAFVVSRRHLLPLVEDHHHVRHRLFPGVSDREFDDHLRALRADADREWRAISKARLAALVREGPKVAELRPGRSVGGRAPTFALLASSMLPRVLPGEVTGAPAPLPRPPNWRVRLGVVALVLLAVVVAGLRYHPPMVVVAPMQPVDVTADITITGVPVHAVSGRYLLLPVRFERPNAFGALGAVLGHRHRLRAVGSTPREQARAASLEARGVFRRSQQEAVVAAVSGAGLDPRTVSVSFRRRDLGGPSGGLVYALALADLLSADDLAAGRAIAATGTIDSLGTVGTVGFVGDKVDGARRSRASLLLVPSSQRSRLSMKGVRPRGVRTLSEALALLRR